MILELDDAGNQMMLESDEAGNQMTRESDDAGKCQIYTKAVPIHNRHSFVGRRVRQSGYIFFSNPKGHECVMPCTLTCRQYINRTLYKPFERMT
jgi:hypothetical protein